MHQNKNPLTLDSAPFWLFLTVNFLYWQHIWSKHNKNSTINNSCLVPLRNKIVNCILKFRKEFPWFVEHYSFNISEKGKHYVTHFIAEFQNCQQICNRLKRNKLQLYPSIHVFFQKKKSKNRFEILINQCCISILKLATHENVDISSSFDGNMMSGY